MGRAKMMQNRTTTIAIYGTGGVGGYFGAVLARAGYSVAFVARGAHLEAIRKDGLHICSPKGDFNVIPAQVTDTPVEIDPVDAIILGVKAWQVPEAALAIRPLLAPATKVLPLQNGVEAPDQLQQVLGREHTLVGLCRIFSSVTSPGHIHHTGMEPAIVLGEPDGSVLSPNGQALVNALQAAGVVVETPPDIQAALWKKLVFGAALSGVGALARATIGEIRECPPARRLLQQLMEEVVSVAQARGIQLGKDVIARSIAFVESMPASGTLSMQRDIADGKPSELEQIIGAIVRLGDQGGVPTPTMECVYAALLPQEIRAREGSQ
ncbi:MAG TPA: 2-dehydropantoate 2-reductase [Terriglobales bacterium]|nr:2-dehydropantoate 2-reductase [Terriglobales bacterium]